ncbi:MAG TPA: adenylate/guanylate cyclase domain-containing protein, partial [Candidatus Limnocylindria bacterium]
MRDTGPAATPNRAATSERRPLTILFADIAGSTSIAEKLDPEDWTVLVQRAFDRLNTIASRYDGTVARLMGDGVLVFFGAPIAHEDDPERAVRCGLDMVREIEGLGGEEHARHGVPLQVRVGINTGPVVVGMVGSDIAREYTAMGDAVNIAARMQAAAPPGGVMITAATHRFVA